MLTSWLGYLTINNIGFLIGVLGFLFSIYTYIRMRERRAIVYKKSEAQIVGGNRAEILGGKVQILFSGRAIERVNKTTFWVWNAGNKTISGDEVAQGDPLRFVVPKKYEVLEFSITAVSSAANNVILKTVTTDALVPAFDFLGPNQGFKCEILHTAPIKSLDIAGTIKGTEPLKDYENYNFMSVLLLILQMLLFVGMSVVAGFAVAALLIWPLPIDYRILRGLIFLVCLIGFPIGAFVIRDKVEEYVSARRPPGSLDFARSF